MKIEIDELKEASEKVVELLRAKGYPYATVIITQDKIVLAEDKIGIPLPYED